ncbi:MAG TPA: CHAT domain-containing protein, partial [Gemmatimonadales bacterium]|nr:CHAT domain-containing protein [Gemmatimonadales bacterium]
PKPRAMQPFKKLARVRAPRRAEPVSTGFATSSRPGEPMDQDRPIAPGEPCHFWLEVGEVEGSIEVRPTPLPVDLLPATARLDVVLFAPDGGFRLKPGEDLGRLDLQPDGTARVASQPARKYGKVDQNLLQRRLLFPLTAPDRSGSYRLRCSIYCRGVLVQSRLIRVEVGDTDRTSRVDFTLATRLDPARLGRLAEQRLAMLSNHRPNGNHDFYLYGRDGNEVFRASISIPPTTLGGALEIARAALRRASWGDEGPWARTKRYRYAGRPRIETLREDLAVLAIAGWRIYDLLVNHLAGGTKKVRAFEALVRQPGLLQISPDATLGLVLPAALIYDYKIQPQAKPPGEFSLCAEFERAFRAATPLEQTACFQGQCPSHGLPTTVCPSGFWGFRHGLGLPISDVETGDEQEAQLDPRLEYQDVPLVVMGLSRSRDLPRTRQHARELQALRPAWGNRGWLVADRLDALMDFMRSKQPHVVYLYCHGSGRPVGAVEFPMLYLGEDPDKAEPGEWLERSMLRGEIEWTKPRPLVFLNGCHTTVLDARTTLDFVTGFVQNARACGVVGTEVTVFEELAGAFARRFMDRFLAGAVVGQAIRDARLDLLRQGNPLGLVYTPFVLSGTQLVPAGT